MKDNKKRCITTLGFVIKDLSNLIKRQMDHNVFNEVDEHMSGVQGWIISFIHDEGKKRDIYQRDIEQEFNIRRSSVTGLLQTLEKNGMIRREAVESDARLKKITLTPKAVESRLMIDRKIKAFDKKLEAGITPEEKKIFLHVAAKMRDNLEGKEN